MADHDAVGRLLGVESLRALDGEVGGREALGHRVADPLLAAEDEDVRGC
ncbi:hypothetical protein [Halosegnis marinus]